MVVKGGLIVTAAMGDPNASIPTPQPVRYRPMFAAYGRAIGSTSVTFVSRAALEAEVPARLGLGKRVSAVTRLPRPHQGGHGPQQLLAPHGSRRGDLRGAGRRPAPHLRARARCCRWRSGTSSSEGSMLVITESPLPVEPAALAGLERDTLSLTWEERRWTRKRVRSTAGREVALALPTGSLLRPGDVLARRGGLVPGGGGPSGAGARGIPARPRGGHPHRLRGGQPTLLARPRGRGHPGSRRYRHGAAPHPARRRVEAAGSDLRSPRRPRRIRTDRA